MQEFMPMAISFAKNHTLMVASWVVVFFAVIYISFKSITSKVKSLNNQQAVTMMNNAQAMVVDLRTLDEFQRGHIIRSLHILPSEIKNKNLGRLDNHKDQPVILVCASGLLANASADELVKQGFTQVYTLKEGIAGWKSANLPLVKH